MGDGGLARLVLQAVLSGPPAAAALRGVARRAVPVLVPPIVEVLRIAEVPSTWLDCDEFRPDSQSPGACW